MKNARQTIDVDIRSAVIAWQPLDAVSGPHTAQAGAVGVFQRYDPREKAFLMTWGACCVAWEAQPTECLVEELVRLKRTMTRDHGIALADAETALARVPEYRSHQAAKRITYRRTNEAAGAA